MWSADRAVRLVKSLGWSGPCATSSRLDIGGDDQLGGTVYDRCEVCGDMILCDVSRGPPCMRRAVITCMRRSIWVSACALPVAGGGAHWMVPRRGS